MNAPSIFAPRLLSPYAAEVLADKPLGFWPMQDGTQPASITRDASGSGVNASVGNGLASSFERSIFPVATMGCLFNLFSTNIIAAVHSRFASTPLTCEGWFRPTSSSGLEYFGLGTLVIGAQLSAGSLQTEKWDDGGFAFIGSSFRPPSGLPLHAVLTLDGTAFKIYVNGTPRGSGTFTATLSSTIALGGNGNGNFPITLGRGYVSNFAVYPSVLPLPRIIAHYRAAMQLVPARQMRGKQGGVPWAYYLRSRAMRGAA